MALETTVKSWRSLVTPYTGQPLPNLLKEASADYDVVLNPIHIYDSFRSSYVAVANQFATGRVVQTSAGKSLENWEVVKGRYEIVPNELILKKAKLLTTKSENAVLQGCGVLDEGRKFFCVINTGYLQIDLAKQHTDTIENNIVVITSHDGSMPITYYNLDVRMSTSAVIRFVSNKSEFCMRKRHTPNEADVSIVNEVEQAIRMRSAWTVELQNVIREFMKPISNSDINKVLEDVWSESDAPTTRKRENIKTIKHSVKELMCQPFNNDTYGQSKWSLLNAINQYIDFGRNVADATAAQQALEIDNLSHRLKIQSFNALKRI